MGKAEDLFDFAIACGCKTLMKLDKEDAMELCREKLREEDGHLDKAMEALLEMDGTERPGPAQRMQNAKGEETDDNDYSEDLRGAFILDEKTAVRVAKAFYKKTISPAGPNVEVDKPLDVRCNSPSCLVWSMLFGSLVVEEPRWYRFVFAATISKQPDHLLESSEVKWAVTEYSESGVSMRDVKRPSLTKRTAAALAKEWYEDITESPYGEHYQIRRQPGSGNWYKSIHVECPAKDLLKLLKSEVLKTEVRRQFERNDITDVMFLVHLVERQDVHSGPSRLSHALEQQCGIVDKNEREELAKALPEILPKMPHIWTMIFDAAPKRVVDDRSGTRPAGMVLHDCSLRFECSLDSKYKKEYEHDGDEWVVSRIIDPFAHLAHHVKSRASAVDQRGDLADEHELLKARLAEAPPPSVVEKAEQRRREVLREAHERFNARSFLLGARQKIPSKKQSEEMHEEAQQAHDDHLKEWAAQQAEILEGGSTGPAAKDWKALTAGVAQDQSKKEKKEGKVVGRMGRKTLGRGQLEEPVPEAVNLPEEVEVHTSLQAEHLEHAAGIAKLGLERKRDAYGKPAKVHTMKAIRSFTEGSTWAAEQAPHEHWQEPIRWTGKTAEVRDGLDARHRSVAIGLAHQPQLHDGQGSRERVQFEHRGMIDGDMVCMRDLEFQKDELIQVTNAKGHWFEGYRKDDPEQRIGRFPSTYVTEYYETMTRFVSVTIFAVHETRAEFEKHAARAGKMVSKTGAKGANVAEASFSSPSVIGPHACDEETGMTATVKVGKPGKWSPNEDGEATSNPVEFVEHTAFFGNTVSGQFGSDTAPVHVDRRGETITVRQKVGIQTVHHAAEDAMPQQQFSAKIEWDDNSSHRVDENFGLLLSRCGHIMGFISHEHGGPVSMAGVARYSRVLAVDGHVIGSTSTQSTVDARTAILDILDHINTHGGLSSVSFLFESDSLPLGWEAREIDVHGEVRYEYVCLFSGHTEDEWPGPDVLKKMNCKDEYKKTGVCYSMPKFVNVQVSRESRHVGKHKELNDVLIGEVQIEIKSQLTELENLRLLYTRLKEEQLEENSKKVEKSVKALRKFEPEHHEMQRETKHIQDKHRLANVVAEHIVHKDLRSKRAGAMIAQPQEHRLREQLQAMSLHELREAAITHGVPVEMTMNHHVDSKVVADKEKYEKKVEKQELQLKLLKKKFEALESKLATPTWYRLERKHDKHGGYNEKGKWERKDPNARGPRGSTMPLWSVADVGYWLKDEVVKQAQFGISPAEAQKIAVALKAEGIDGRTLGKLGESGLAETLPSALRRHATNLAKAVEAEAKDPKKWRQESRLARLNHVKDQFDNDPPAWVKLSIAVTHKEPEDEKPTRVKHHTVATTDVHHFHLDRAHSKETKRSMFLRACCGRPEATDKLGRPTTRREHALKVAAAKTATPRDIVMTVKEGELPGFKLDDELIVVGKVDGVAKKYGILQGMYLYAFKPASESLMVMDSLGNDGVKNGYKFSDVNKLVAKYATDKGRVANFPHEYHFRLDRYGDQAKAKFKRQGVWVKGYGYAPVGGEPVDVINAIRDKLASSTMAVKNHEGMRVAYKEFLKEASRIKVEMQKTTEGLPPGTKLTDPLRYNGDNTATPSTAAIFQELNHPFGRSAASLLDERHYKPKELAQILIYWLDRQVHNASKAGARSADVQPGIVGHSQFAPWSQKVELDRMVGAITPVEFERAIEDVTHAVGCTTKCEVTHWEQKVVIYGVPILAATLQSSEGDKQLREGLAEAHGLGQKHHRGSLHHGKQQKQPSDQVEILDVRSSSRGVLGAASDVEYRIKGNMIHAQKVRGKTLSPKVLADSLNDAEDPLSSEPLPKLHESDFITNGPGVRTSKMRCETKVHFTVTAETKGIRAPVSKMREALGFYEDSIGVDADVRQARERQARDRVKMHLNRVVAESRTLIGKLRVHTGSAAPPDEIEEIGAFKMDGDPQVTDEVEKYKDAIVNPKSDPGLFRFRSFIFNLREPSRTTLRGLVFLIREVMKYAMDPEEDSFEGKFRFCLSQQLFSDDYPFHSTVDS